MVRNCYLDPLYLSTMLTSLLRICNTSSHSNSADLVRSVVAQEPCLTVLLSRGSASSFLGLLNDVRSALER